MSTLAGRAREDRVVATATGVVRVCHWPGVGSPTVFVHGLGGEAPDWTEVVERLGDLDCYAVDLPGFGASPPPRIGWRDRRRGRKAHHRLGIADQSLVVAAAIEQLGVGPVRLVGNSLGGAIAVQLAATRPDLVSSLALLCPALPDFRIRRSVAELLVVLLPVVGPALGHVVAHGDPGRLADRIFATCYGDPAAIPAERRQAEIELIARRAALPHSDTVYRESLRGLVASNLMRGPAAPWRQAARIGVPVLVIYGGRDRLVDARVATRARRSFPDVTVVVLADCGHLPHLEMPDVTAELLTG
jgi:pimeloyl-ACP methyl ester carboxylesterase